MLWEIDITKTNPRDIETEKALKNLGLEGSIDAVLSSKKFFLDTTEDFTNADAIKVAEGLLVRPFVEDYNINNNVLTAPKTSEVQEVVLNLGVMDPEEQSTMKAFVDIGYKDKIKAVKTGTRYILAGELTQADLEEIARSKLLVNITTQHLREPDEEIFETPSEYEFKRIEVPIRTADDDRLKEISGPLSLNPEEMKVLQNHFIELGRDPTDAELETIGQTWSEHCVHKTFRGLINFNGETIDDMLSTYLKKATDTLNKPWVLSAFHDNSGVIEFHRIHPDKESPEDECIAFKVETHNHPSALEPYGGAGTGIGGVIRDPLGTGLGAEPIVNTDVFCFGELDTSYENIPTDTQHPKALFRGVHGGVRDYGNRMGIPTVNGAVLFDDRYKGNPLVFCGNVGKQQRKHVNGEVKTGYKVVVVGGGTGKDGIRGVTFASVELVDGATEEVFGAPVQIGNPIEEKKMTDCIIQARDQNLYSAITDCGGGGLSSAVGEMGEETGVKVDLEKVPLKYQGLEPWQIWISEAQERMVLAVPDENVEKLITLFQNENVPATVIGEFTDTKRLELSYKGNNVADMDMDFLHNGVPRLTRTAVWDEKTVFFPTPEEKDDYAGDLLAILASPNVCSKESPVRQYDHEVQGRTVIKPFVGKDMDGPGDAAVITPIRGNKKGLVISNGINPMYESDTYNMAMSAIDEALRNIIAVGGNLDRVALLDNFSWGNPNKPDRLGALVRAVQGCHDGAMHFEAPFISGKDSLNNEYDGERIPHTLLISAIGVMPDISKAITMDIKESDNLIYIVGETHDEMGGSHYFKVNNIEGGLVPGVRDTAKPTMDALSKATANGYVRSCHDLSEGGLAVAAAEMAFAGGLGIEIDLAGVPTHNDSHYTNSVLLFSESNSRFLVEVKPEDVIKFEQAMNGYVISRIGKVTDDETLRIESTIDKKDIIKENIYTLKQAWQKTLGGE